MAKLADAAMASNAPDLLATARRVFAIEIGGLQANSDRLNGDFEQACRLILACRGRVVCLGMGKSGHIARKLSLIHI